MLDLLACVLNSNDAESGGGTFEEVTEGGELWEVRLLSAGINLTLRVVRMITMGIEGHRRGVVEWI